MITQITKVDFDSRLLPWWDKAIKDPAIARFLSFDRYHAAPKAPEDDWSHVNFMDEENIGRLSIGLDRERQTANVSLYVLNNRTDVAARLWKFLIIEVVNLYGIKHITFSVSETNVAWLTSLTRRFREYQWGIHPMNAWDPVWKGWVATHHFFIPVHKLIYAHRQHRR